MINNFLIKLIIVNKYFKKYLNSNIQIKINKMMNYINNI